MAKTTMLVVHAHDPGEGSTILAVLRDNERGRVLADKLQAKECGGQEVNVEAVVVTDVPLPSQVSPMKLRVLTKISDAKPLADDDFRHVPRLLADGYLQNVTASGRSTLELTAIGRALISPTP